MLAGLEPSQDDAALRISHAAFEAARARQPGRATLRGIGTFFFGSEPFVTGPRCRALAEGDRALTARWSIRGYGGQYSGRCTTVDAGCARRLARVLHTAGKTLGEPLRTTWSVARENDEGRALVVADRHCVVGP